jgi:hypothetical protein
MRAGARLLATSVLEPLRNGYEAFGLKQGGRQQEVMAIQGLKRGVYCIGFGSYREPA